MFGKINKLEGENDEGILGVPAVKLKCLQKRGKVKRFYLVIGFLGGNRNQFRSMGRGLSIWAELGWAAQFWGHRPNTLIL